MPAEAGIQAVGENNNFKDLDSCSLLKTRRDRFRRNDGLSSYSDTISWGRGSGVSRGRVSPVFSARDVVDPHRLPQIGVSTSSIYKTWSGRMRAYEPNQQHSQSIPRCRWGLQIVTLGALKKVRSLEPMQDPLISFLVDIKKQIIRRNLIQGNFFINILHGLLLRLQDPHEHFHFISLSPILS